MRIGIVSPQYPPHVSGGGEISVKLLVDHLAAHEAVSEVVVHTFDGHATETVGTVEVRRLGTVSTRVKELANLRCLPVLRDRLGSFDLVHAYNMAFHPTVGVLSALKGFPAVATLNSYEFYPRSVIGLQSTGIERFYELVGYPTTGRLLLGGMRKIDAFVALSRSVEEVYRHNGFSSASIRTIPNMIDPSFDVPSADETSDLGGGFTLLYVGALKKIKGVDVLIRAMALLPDDVRLRVAGSGPLEPRLRALAGELGVAKRVDFLGYVPYDHVRKLYSTADLFVHPGVWPEPFGRTILESMQAGVPVVVTHLGGPSEIVPDSRFLCEPGDPEDLAATVRFALEERPNERRDLREYVERTYAPDVVLSQLLDLYHDVLGA